MNLAPSTHHADKKQQKWDQGRNNKNKALNHYDCETLWLAGRILVLLRIRISFVVEFLKF
jgi:hypothetical protein